MCVVCCCVEPCCDGGDVAYCIMAGDVPPIFSDIDIFESMVSASGKLGGVAGVLAGVHIWKYTR